jgi:hypothetical protein
VDRGEFVRDPFGSDTELADTPAVRHKQRMAGA